MADGCHPVGCHPVGFGWGWAWWFWIFIIILIFWLAVWGCGGFAGFGGAGFRNCRPVC